MPAEDFVVLSTVMLLLPHLGLATTTAATIASESGRAVTRTINVTNTRETLSISL